MFGSTGRFALACALGSALTLYGCGRSKRTVGGEAGEDSNGAGSGSGGRSAGGSGANSAGSVSITPLYTGGADKVDLLFMIDNSMSMAHKQSLLAEALPVLMARLIQPTCLSAEGEVTDTQPCPSGFAPEFPAIDDIHIGIITSSLGHHGSHDVCSDETDGRTPDDRAQLLPSVRPNANLASWNGQGFLVWDPRSDDGTIESPHVPPGWGAPGGPGGAADLVSAFANQIAEVGEFGCGLEGQLESWYRFLVDPEPVVAMENDLEFSVRIAGANQLVLQQRAAFLRHDSLLAIVMLTDENDCSILDEAGTRGWLVPYKGGPEMNSFRMSAATNSCKQNPNDPCCRPCVLPAAPGCGDDAAEGCPEGGYLVWSSRTRRSPKRSVSRTTSSRPRLSPSSSPKTAAARSRPRHRTSESAAPTKSSSSGTRARCCSSPKRASIRADRTTR